jgi:hypothetical protein
MSNTQLQSIWHLKITMPVHSLRDERERRFQYKDDKRRKGPNTRDGYRQHCSKCCIKHDQNKCPAEGKTCTKCKMLNHFARMCKSKLKVKEKKGKYMELKKRSLKRVTVN